eukprot:TRINITY_DN7068_c0_g2_i2.p1 TRINITY_DN7068_c0_g2~~TRINITY_DN7068_c0_g2_i2.p1  ORF type:complete len:151 (-),score=41.83 TRINITY_DN7068_c0_g2_i2:8-460(-)
MAKKLGVDEQTYRKEAFGFFDFEKIGAIKAKETISAMRSLGIILTSAQARDLTTEIDRDFGGIVKFEQFNALCDRQPKVAVDRSKDLKILFRFLDDNQDGIVDGKTLRRYFTTIGDRVSDEEITQLFITNRVPVSGEIDFALFCRMMDPN